MAQSFLSQGLVDERAKMEWVPEVLQFPIIIKRRRALSIESQLLQKLDFLFGRVTAHGLVPKEFFEPWLFLRLGRFPFDKLKFLRVIRNKSPIQNDSHTEGRDGDIPGFDHRIHEVHALLNEHLEDIRLQKL